MKQFFTLFVSFAIFSLKSVVMDIFVGHTLPLIGSEMFNDKVILWLFLSEDLPIYHMFPRGILAKYSCNNPVICQSPVPIKFPTIRATYLALRHNTRKELVRLQQLLDLVYLKFSSIHLVTIRLTIPVSGHSKQPNT